MNPVTVGPVSIDISAPPALVFQMLAAIGQGAQSGGERAEVIEQKGDEYVCDFWTRVSIPVGRDRLIRTRERVVLQRPDRIHYEHLDGPIRGLQESIRVEDAPGGSRITYHGIYHPRGLLDRFRAAVIARPAIHRVMRDHFADVQTRAEARAARSRAFPTPARTD